LDTFWYMLFFFLVAVPLIVVWLGCVIDVVARPQMGFFKKALWVIAMLAFPFFGCIVYLITRPKEVVVTEPGTYDQIYAGGPYEFPTSSKAGAQVLGGKM
jgi:Phospholipase_D-nuclease N-terminal